MKKLKTISAIITLGTTALLTDFGSEHYGWAVTVEGGILPSAAQTPKPLPKAEAKPAIPVKAPSSTPAPTATVAGPAIPTGATPVPTPTFTSEEKKKLLKEFKRAKGVSEKALKHEETYEMKVFTSTQTNQARQWREAELKARHNYFDTHLKSSEKRAYVLDYQVRLKAFDKMQKDDLAAKKKEWSDRYDQFRKTNAANEIEFKKSLDQNQRPGPELWPKP